MIKELTDIVTENWWMIPPITLGIYGCIETSRGIYNIIKTGTNQGTVKVMRGTIALFFAGISDPILYKIAEHLQH